MPAPVAPADEEPRIGRTLESKTAPVAPAVTALRECMASIETLGFSGDIAHGVWARWQDIVGKETP